MAASDQVSARFRSATEFPKTIAGLEQDAADSLYVEMRDCLIFTNRSRAQLIRRNEEHKQSALKLKVDVERLQGLIKQLTAEKQLVEQNKQSVIADLEREISSMATHLDQLSDAFDKVADIESMPQSQWGFLALPSRFFSFLRAVRAIVTFWREESGDSSNAKVEGSTTPTISGETDAAARKDQPQMYDDPASVNRSLLDR